MKPAQPLPTAPPLLSFYTPTFRRPAALTANLASVGKQTAAHLVEQIVLPDHVGYGVAGGLYGRLPWYADAFRGAYINFLCDDDVLASDDVVAKLAAFIERERQPAVIIAKVVKNGLALPMGDPLAPPVAGSVDLTSYIVRRDVWKQHVTDYGLRYEGDADHATALYQAGHRHAYFDVLWATGGARHGRPELDY